MQMTRIAVLLAASLGIVDPSQAQEVTLACSGFFTSYEPPAPQSSTDGLSILLNLKTGKARTIVGDMTIIKTMPDVLVYSQPLVEGELVTGKTSASINRITGRTSIWRDRDAKPDQPIFLYELTCRLSRRMF